MIDQMYLRKSAQYQSGENVEEGNLYKGIFAFLIVELKQSTLSLFKPFQKSHLTESGWPRKLVITSTVS